MTSPILPGSTIGVLGSGQLGRMFAIAARRMGYRVHTFSPETDTPTGQVADVESRLRGPRRRTRFHSPCACGDIRVREHSRDHRQCRRRTRVGAAKWRGPAHHTTPSARKDLPGARRIPCHSVSTRLISGGLQAGVYDLGLPAVLKTAGFGYDGKGQSKITSLSEAEAALQALEGQEAILEAFIDFEREVSVVAARGLDGLSSITASSRTSIVSTSWMCRLRQRVSPKIAQEAREIARSILEALDVVGVLCVEFFSHAMASFWSTN